MTFKRFACKATLLRLMNMTLCATRGEVTILALHPALHAGVQCQNAGGKLGQYSDTFGLLPHLSAFKNVALPLRIDGRPRSQVRADVVELLR